MLRNLVGGVGVDKPSLKTLLEEQTLTFEGLKEKISDT
jgi:hypothetical protein